MIAKGEFNYFLDGESKTIDEIRKLANIEMTVSVIGLDVHYFSPKKSKKRPYEEFKDVFGVDFSPLKGKIQEILKQADEHQAKNGGILRGVEFPFDYTGTIGIEEITDIVTKEREQKVIEDWNKPRPKFEEALKSGEQFKFNTTPENSNFGKKENNGKIDYSEIDFDILDLMANRFNANKHKYPAGNMLKPIEEKELLFALLRHLKKMIQPIETDIETFEEHLAAILCNAQMIYQQRKLQSEPNIYRRRSHK